MSLTARDYLLDRFRTDAAVLRQRADAMKPGAKVAGPDAATSRRMADACDEVVAMLAAMATTGDANALLEAIVGLIPLLEQRAAAHGAAPLVRAVYAGAATRIREVRDAEARTTAAATAGAIDDHEDDALDGLDDSDDPDADDDDLPPVDAADEH